MMFTRYVLLTLLFVNSVWASGGGRRNSSHVQIQWKRPATWLIPNDPKTGEPTKNKKVSSLKESWDLEPKIEQMKTITIQYNPEDVDPKSKVRETEEYQLLDDILTLKGDNFWQLKKQNKRVWSGMVNKTVNRPNDRQLSMRLTLARKPFYYFQLEFSYSSQLKTVYFNPDNSVFDEKASTEFYREDGTQVKLPLKIYQGNLRRTKMYHCKPRSAYQKGKMLRCEENERRTSRQVNEIMWQKDIDEKNKKAARQARISGLSLKHAKRLNLHVNSNKRNQSTMGRSYIDVRRLV